MADWDVKSYDIKERLPEWWKHDAFLEPINRYSQELVRNIIGGLLENLGVYQPVQVWKQLPTEYSWVHHYVQKDKNLITPEGHRIIKTLNPNEPIRAMIPNSKRSCHGIIQLKLLGENDRLEKPLKKLTIKNANQEIAIHDITTTTDIKIITESGTILINGIPQSRLVTGRFDKIYSQPLNTNYSQVDVDDENKTTYIEIESDTKTNFDLQVKLVHPVYVTEQHIRIHTVSAFPIESVKLYGFFCHDFNDKQEWKFLWEKNYSENDRVVHDYIVKQFNCETFYVQVKLHGIGVPFTYGFPQEELHSNAAFQTNKKLDTWGKILGLPRRTYRSNITDAEEPYTYPPYYKYDIEQDYWYEQRLVNEYQHNDDAVNANYIKDSNMGNVALLKCIDPFVRDIYVYTETINSVIDNNHQTDDIFPSNLTEDGDGVTWNKPYTLKNHDFTASEVILQPKTSQSINDYQNQTKVLSVHFNKEDMPILPKNIKITGIELQLYGLTDIHSDALILDPRSQMLITTAYGTETNDVVTKTDRVQIDNDIYRWEKGKGVYNIGGKNDLFGLKNITREQIQNGLVFNLGFTNKHDFLKSTIILYGLKLHIYYETIEDEYNIDVQFNRKEIVLSDPSKQSIEMKIKFHNTGTIPAIDKNVYIAVPPELNISHNKFPQFDLDVDEEFTIGEHDFDNIIITPSEEQLTGLYDIIVFCNDKVIKNEIMIRRGF
ncbi:hypothetical protein [uncultured Methanobrevibacter sp.]|uniref:hypothetical protein n=1 Tax=uncultured Methanobrevibacter sp. TaxID=253161 RepID=UPI0025F3BFC4|nr:hypothetical protein [uncultured Methanobrevibacter sp.]